MTKTTLGLDLGTNSIGWALVKSNAEDKSDFGTSIGKILGMGSRIIPMSQDILNNFSAGVSHSQTANRTAYRGARRLRERHLLRRERLHRVLNILGLLPTNYAKKIDFDKRLGKFLPNTEPKLTLDEEGKFVFMKSFLEMINDFPEGTKVPLEWTIYYLRKKALTDKISKQELAWILLNFNQKRGYYQQRGDIEEEVKDKLVEFHTLKITDVIDTGENRKNETWYNCKLENGWVYKRASKVPLNDWIGKTRDFIVTTSLDADGNPKVDDEGAVKRTFRSPKEDDWTLVKKKTEKMLEDSNKTVGAFIYDTLLEKKKGENIKQKVRGKLITTIERDFYKDELLQILNKQKEHHAELRDEDLYKKCVNELYKSNEAHRNMIANKDLTYLFVEDILFYHRPLKSKKHLIGTCRFEKRSFINAEGKKEEKGIRGVPKSHPLFQEFRIWNWINNLRIIQKQKEIDGKLKVDEDVTQLHLKNSKDKTHLFDFLNTKKQINEKQLLGHFGLEQKTHKWNYVRDDKVVKYYPCNETRYDLLKYFDKAGIEIILEEEEDAKSDNKPSLTYKQFETPLWHLLYSVDDLKQLKKGLTKFAGKNNLPDAFVDAFIKFPKLDKDYGSYSLKAIKKLLPLIRVGKYWSEEDIVHKFGLYYGNIKTVIKDKLKQQQKAKEENKHFNSDFLAKLQLLDDAPSAHQGLELHTACYATYARFAEADDTTKWKNPKAISDFLKNEFKQHSLRNPIVEQVISETLRLVADVWQQYGNGEKDFFDAIHIELGRELKNPKDVREQITASNLKNQNTNQRIRYLLAEFAKDPKIKGVVPYSTHQQEKLKIFEDNIVSNYEMPDDVKKIASAEQPTQKQIERYKLWLEQKYVSPYTREPIKLSDLFDRGKYEIEHIIPQATYFDNSFNNKVICEAEVNKLKDKELAYNFIENNEGTEVQVNGGMKTVKILSIEKYEKLVEQNFSGNDKKKKNLLRTEIPTKMIERQLNDTRYISKKIMGLLSNIVREPGELDHKAKRILNVNGAVTARLRNDWGLNNIWNELITPRFKRMNKITNSNNYGSINEKIKKFLPDVPIDEKKDFKKKRIDHRHHPLDAVLIACCTLNHTNLLNNETHLRAGKTKEEKKKIREDLKAKLMYNKKTTNHKTGKTEKETAFKKPWENFEQDVLTHLKKTVASFKQNTRVINKTTNYYQRFIKNENGQLKKKSVKQTKGDSWAIRKPLHKETVYGKVKVKVDNNKIITLNKALEQPYLIVDKQIRKHVLESIKTLNTTDVKLVKKHFKTNPIIIEGKKIERVKVWQWLEGTASRNLLDTSFNEKKIRNITDSGIQKILLRHLNKPNYQNQTDEEGKDIAPEKLAFTPEGITDMNVNIAALNNGKFHQPIYKVRTWEEGSRFAVGYKNSKSTKYVEAAKGTNLFYAVYQKDDKRNYTTIPLNEVIEHQKQMAEEKIKDALPIPIHPNNGQFLFYLTVNDLVYVPLENENINEIDFSNLNEHQINRIYKAVSFNKKQAFFIQANVAYPIKNKFEFSSLNKMERSINGDMIKAVCIKLNIDRLGNISLAKY